MKKIVLFLCILTTSIVLHSNDFQKGNIEFSNNNYTKAIELYNKDLEVNGNSFNTLYNLGNAYLKNDMSGNALYYLKKAYIINPRNRDLVNIINKTEEDLGIENNKILSYIPLSPRELQILLVIFILLLSLILFLITLFKYFSKIDSWFYKSRRSILLICGSFVIFLSALNIVNFHNRKWALTLNSSRVLVSPYTESKESFTIGEGITVKIEDRFDNFYFVYDSNDRYGWVEVDSIGIFWKK